MLPGGSTFSQKMQPPSDGLKREHTEESITSKHRQFHYSNAQLKSKQVQNG